MKFALTLLDPSDSQVCIADSESMADGVSSIVRDAGSLAPSVPLPMLLKACAECTAAMECSSRTYAESQLENGWYMVLESR